MARIEPIEHDRASGRARELLDELASRGIEPGPMVRTMADAPALLRGYLDLNRAMKRSHLDRWISERIAPAQEWIGCDYCLVAHTEAARELSSPASKRRRPRPRAKLLQRAPHTGPWSSRHPVAGRQASRRHGT